VVVGEPRSGVRGNVWYSRQRMATLVILLILAFSSPALAWNEPSGFRDVPWGASIETVKEKIPELTCLEASCSGTLPVGPTKPYANVMFRNGGLDNIVLIFPAVDFFALEPIFVERYGQPTAKTDALLVWIGKKVHISLSRLGPSPAQGMAMIRTTAGLDEETKKRQEKVKEGKKDL
jgi:hypothetical protein